MDIFVLIIIAATCIFSYMGFNNTVLFEKYKFNVGAIANRKEYIRLISSAFLHADFMHLFFNMLSCIFPGGCGSFLWADRIFDHLFRINDPWKLIQPADLSETTLVFSHWSFRSCFRNYFCLHSHGTE